MIGAECIWALWICLISISFSLQGQEIGLPEKMDRLIGGDLEQIPDLVKQKEASLEILKQRLFPPETDVSALLNMLGSDRYKERIQAVETLSGMGSGIRLQLLEYRRKHSNDPEIMTRTGEVLQNLKDREPKIDHQAVVAFLVACGQLESDTILLFSTSYQKVFKKKPKELFRAWEKSRNTKESFQPMALQMMQIPELRTPFLEWMLNQHVNVLKVINLMRELLKQDFANTYKVLPFYYNYSEMVDRMIEMEFERQLTEELLLHRLKKLYDRNSKPPTFEFDPSEPMTPGMAFQLLTIDGFSSLPRRYRMYLLDQLSPIPREELVRLIETTTLNEDVLGVLAEQFPEIHPELKTKVLQRLHHPQHPHEFSRMLRIATEELQIKFKPGDLDASWIKLFETEPHNRGHLLITGQQYQIQPELFLNYWKEYHTLLRKPGGIQSFEYLLTEGNDGVRQETLSVMATLYARFEINPAFLLETWRVLTANSKDERPEFTLKKLEFLANQTAEELYPLSFVREQLGRNGSALLSLQLDELYQAHPEIIEGILTSENASSRYLPLCLMMSEVRSLPESTRVALHAVYSKALTDKGLRQDTRLVLHEAQLNLDPFSNTSLSELLESFKQRNGSHRSFMKLPVWRLDESNRALLPMIREQISKEEGLTKAFCLRLGLFIDPDFSGWKQEVDTLLQEGSVEEVSIVLQALVILDREPDLSKLPIERRQTLFDFFPGPKERDRNHLIEHLRRKENCEVALQAVNGSQLGNVLEHSHTTITLKGLIARSDSSWRILGEGLMEHMEGADLNRAAHASFLMQPMASTIPASVLPRFLRLLKQPDTHVQIRLHLQYLLGFFGQPDEESTNILQGMTFAGTAGQATKLFAFAAIHPDPQERAASFKALIKGHREIGHSYYLEWLSALPEFQHEWQEYSREVMVETQQSPHPRITRSKMGSLLDAIENNTGTPEALRIYQDFLQRIASPDQQADATIRLTPVILRHLLKVPLEDLAGFDVYLEALPFKAKHSAEYRTVMEWLSHPEPQ